MKIKLRTWVKVLIVILFLIILLFIYGHFISPKLLQINRYSIINNKIPNNFNNIKIVHISDIHYNTTIKEKELRQIIMKINKLKPDIVIISGDLLDNSVKYTTKDKNTLIKCLSKIDNNLGVYIIKGDNDINSIWSEIVNNSNLISLENSYKLIYNSYENPILISGLNSNFNNNKFSISNEETIKTKYKILIMHEPDYINKININDFDLILAGHSLGGIIKVPIIQKLFLPTNSKNYYKDYYKIKNTDFYISSGIGTNKIKIRLFNNPSINIYTLKNK